MLEKKFTFNHLLLGQYQSSIAGYLLGFANYLMFDKNINIGIGIKSFTDLDLEITIKYEEKYLDEIKQSFELYISALNAKARLDSEDKPSKSDIFLQSKIDELHTLLQLVNRDFCFSKKLWAYLNEISIYLQTIIRF